MSTDPAEWLKLIQQGRGEVLDVADYLFELSISFKRTGNGEVADKLMWLAASLRAAEEKIKQGEGLELSRALHQAQESSGLLVKAALAGTFSGGAK